MRHIITLIAFILIGQSCFAATVLKVGKMYTAPPVSSAYTPDIVAEDFETGALPAGWFASAPPVKWDDSTGALLGTYSMWFTNNAGYTQFDPSLSPLNEFYMMFYWKASSFATHSMMTFSDIGETNRANVYTRNTGELQVIDEGAGTSVTSANAMSTANTNYIWIHWKKGTTGANSVLTAAFSPVMSYPADAGNIATFSTGNNTNSIVNITFYGCADAADTRFDHLGISSDNAMTLGWSP